MKKTLTKLNNKFLKNSDKKQIPNFIYSISFPYYKNIKPFSKINFEYPLIVLVGPNGSGKSTVLQALEGAPKQTSLTSRWFSTHVDPIPEESKLGIPNCYWFEYFNKEANEMAQVLNSRIKKEGNPDYWEPSRPIQKYGMKKFKKQKGKGKILPGRTKTRWMGLKKTVLYIDFRAELSSFDKFFYFGDPPKDRITIKTKQDYLRQKSKYLKEVFELKLNKKEIYGRNRVFDFVEIEPEILKTISEILGKNYSQAFLVEHSFYEKKGFSVLFSMGEREYSEAFAGSGEMSVTKLVYLMMNAPKNSLILLDEPEVSLHPGAQKRMIEFFLKICLKQGHQIILSTHSPTMIESLPPEAIKVFTENPEGNIEIKENISPELAFQFIGHNSNNKIRIMVEDEAAKQLLKKIVTEGFQEGLNLVDISFHGGGAQDYFKEALVLSRLKYNKTFFLLDGDQKTVPIPEDEEISNNLVDELIKKITGINSSNFDYSIDGGSNGGNQSQLLLEKRNFIQFLKQQFFFFPTDDPEEIIWKASLISEKPDLINNDNSLNYKEKIKVWAENEIGSVNSEQISTYRLRLLKNFDLNHDLVKKTKSFLDIIFRS